MPTTAPDIVLTPVDTAVVIDPLANDSGEGLVLDGFTQPAHGIVVANPDGTLTYTPAPGFAGVDSFTYTVRDAAGATATGTVTVSVLAPNEPPVAGDDEAATAAGTAIEIPVLANDADPDGDALRLVAIGQPVHGTANFRAPDRIRYVPQPGFSGIDRFSYTIDDGNGGVATGSVTVRVAGANRDPVAADVEAETTDGTPLVLDLLARASDPDGDPLRLEALGVPRHGRITVNSDRTVTYTPQSGWSGTDSFTWTVGDGRGGLATGTVRVRVVRPNLPPAANDDTLTTPQDTPLVFDPLANASDPDGDPLRLAGFSLPRHGRLALDADGRLVYTPDPGFTGEDGFTWTIDDGRGGIATGTVRITVTPAEPPAEVFANGFRFRRRILLPARQQAPEVIEGFVLLVKEEGGWLKSTASGGQVESPEGFDLRFELEDGTKLAHEIERYDPQAGSLVAWVRIPSWDIATTLTLFLYYGKTGLTASEADPASTWQDHLAVWDPLTGRDRSGRGRDLVATGVVPDELVGPAGRFDGNGARLVGDVSDLFANLDTLVVTATVRPDPAMSGTDRGILAQGPTDGADVSAGLVLQYLARTSGGATSVLHFKVRTSAGNAYVLTESDTQPSAATVLHAIWRRGQLPEIWRDGARLAASAGNAPDAPSEPTEGTFRIGAGARDGTGNGFIGLIREARLRRSVPAPAMLEIEAKTMLTPELSYGLGAFELPGDTGPVPVAVPFTLQTNAGSWVEVELPESYSVRIIGGPSNGVVSLLGHRLRYTPRAGFIGEDRFIYALVAADGRTSSATVRVTTVSSGASGSAWHFLPPPVPADPADIVVWHLPNTGNRISSPPPHAPGQVILAVLPAGGWSGQLDIQLSCPLIIVGGRIVPPAMHTRYKDGVPYAGINGVLWIRFAKNATYRGRRPFVWISNVDLDYAANNLVWGDFCRIGSMFGTEIDKLGELYIQYLRHVGKATAGFTDDSGNKAPHSDFYQGSHGSLWRIYVAHAHINWAYQTFYYSPGEGIGSYHPGQTAYLHKVKLDSSDRHAVGANRVASHFKTYKDGKYDHGSGLYFATAMSETWIVPDSTQSAAEFFSPSDPGGTSVTLSGNKFVFPGNVGGTHTLPEFSGDCWYAAPAQAFVTAADTGDALRVTTAAQLQAMWPGGVV